MSCAHRNCRCDELVVEEGGTLVAEPLHRSGWIFEEKYDGYRNLAR